MSEPIHITMEMHVTLNDGRSGKTSKTFYPETEEEANKLAQEIYDTFSLATHPERSLYIRIEGNGETKRVRLTSAIPINVRK